MRPEEFEVWVDDDMDVDDMDEDGGDVPVGVKNWLLIGLNWGVTGFWMDGE